MKWRLTTRRLDFWRLANGGFQMAARDKWLLGHLAAGTNGGWWDKWLLDHLAVETFGGQSRSLQKDKWLLGHLAAGTFGGWDIWRSGHLAVRAKE